MIFYDRLKSMARAKSLLVNRLLAYALVHEIAHLLQGMVQHSDSGIMKDDWDLRDIWMIQQNALHFTPLDVELMYRGLAARTAHEP